MHGGQECSVQSAKRAKTKDYFGTVSESKADKCDDAEGSETVNPKRYS